MNMILILSIALVVSTLFLLWLLNETVNAPQQEDQLKIPTVKDVTRKRRLRAMKRTIYRLTHIRR